MYLHRLISILPPLQTKMTNKIMIIFLLTVVLMCMTFAKPLEPRGNIHSIRTFSKSRALRSIINDGTGTGTDHPETTVKRRSKRNTAFFQMKAALQLCKTHKCTYIHVRDIDGNVVDIRLKSE